jgi:hypothetical protein
MKRLLLGMLVLMFAVGCGKEIAEIADPENCQNVYNCDYTDEEIQACCTASQCRYIVGDKEFTCDGTNCNDAAEDVANYCVR